MWIHLLVIAAAVATFGDGAVNARATDRDERFRRLDARLRVIANAGIDAPQRVIIRVRPGARDAMKRTLASRGGSLVADHAAVEALTAFVRGKDLEALANGSTVLSVSADAVVRPNGLLGGLLGGVLNLAGGLVTGLSNTVGSILDPSEMVGPPVPPKVLRETLGLSSQWTGRGIGIAVIDSGLEMSADFDGRIAAFYDFTEGRSLQTTPSDGYGHGTHVAGTIAGTGALSVNRDYRGIAPNAKLLVLKVLDQNGAGYTSDVIRAIDFAVTNRVRYGIQIINLSLGHPILEPAATDPLVAAVERATSAGVIVVTAAGNQGKNPDTGLTGYAGITSPGNAPSALTAGALKTDDTAKRDDDRIPDYSSAGPTWFDGIVKPDIIAPGHNIIAAAAKKGTIYKSYPQLKAADGDYMRLSGTSMASAVTSGVVALALEAHRATQGAYVPRPTPNAIKAALHYTAIAVHNDLGLQDDPLREGSGSLNGHGAIELARAMDTSSPYGAYWLAPSPSPWSIIGGQAVPWQQQVIWGNGIIWGSTASINQQAWSTGIIWGSSADWDNGIIWGSNDLVWTNPQSWASGIIWGSNAIGTQSYSDEGIIWGSTDGMTSASTAWRIPEE